jgi:hypothetical protein
MHSTRSSWVIPSALCQRLLPGKKASSHSGAGFLVKVVYVIIFLSDLCGFRRLTPRAGKGEGLIEGSSFKSQDRIGRREQSLSYMLCY